jgi:hypothetical protein
MPKSQLKPSAVSREPTGVTKKNLTFFPWDLQRIAAAERFVRTSGRKGETALTVRTLIHHSPLNAAFLQRYDALHNRDPRRAKKTKR